MLDIGLAKLFGFAKGGVLAAAKHKALDSMWDMASEKVIAYATQQMPRWGGLTPDDEAILATVDASLEVHHEGSLKKIAAVRKDLSDDENRRWRMIITCIKLEGLTTTIPGGKKTREYFPSQKGDQGDPKLKKEVIEALTVPRQPLSKDDPRVEHLAYVATLVRDAVGGAFDASEAVEYLRTSFLSEDSFSKRLKSALALIWNVFSANAAEAFKFLSVGFGKLYAMVILGDIYDDIDQQLISDDDKLVEWADAINLKTRAVRAQRRELSKQWFPRSLWIWAAVIAVALMAAIPFFLER